MSKRRVQVTAAADFKGAVEGSKPKAWYPEIMKRFGCSEGAAMFAVLKICFPEKSDRWCYVHPRTGFKDTNGTECRASRMVRKGKGVAEALDWMRSQLEVPLRDHLKEQIDRATAHVNISAADFLTEEHGEMRLKPWDVLGEEKLKSLEFEASSDGVKVRMAPKPPYEKLLSRILGHDATKAVKAKALADIAAAVGQNATNHVAAMEDALDACGVDAETHGRVLQAYRTFVAGAAGAKSEGS